MKDHDFKVLNQLRRNSRQSLASISLKAKIPASTVFKSVRRLGKKGVVRRYASCPDYERLGFGIRALIALKADDRNALKEFLIAEPCVNNVVKVSGEYEFLAEILFEGMLGMDEFMEKLSALPGVQKRIWHVVEEMKKEEFLPLPSQQSVKGKLIPPLTIRGGGGIRDKGKHLGRDKIFKVRRGLQEVNEKCKESSSRMNSGK